MRKINVTKTFMPPIEEYQAYLQKIWQSQHLTNQGPLLLEFENQIKEYLKVPDFHFVANGTLALQVAMHALDIRDGEVITTPFSYVATTSSILWERCTPVFVDIDEQSLCIDPKKVEAAITPQTKAIMAVHVFGHPCDTEALDVIAKKHDIKIIYDGAHAFGVRYKGKSLLSYGDVSTLSFHATKLFHTIEGGGIIVKNPAESDNIELVKRFGHHGDEHSRLGINAKASEFQAAMGLCNLKYIDGVIKERRQISELYEKLLPKTLERPKMPKETDYNYGYFPVLCESEEALLEIIELLNQEDIYPRRYFYPSLNRLPYLDSYHSCPVSEDIASRVMCLPLYSGLSHSDVKRICDIITR